MHKPKIILSVAALLFICLTAFTDSFAQTQSKQFEPSYEVFLQIITASNTAGNKTPVPQSLSGVVKKLRNNYSFSGFQLDSTYLQRTSGSIEFKSVSNALNQNQDNFAPIFSDWALLGLRSLPDAQGKKSIQFQSFRFGQRVPVKTSAGVVNYERVGITLQSFGVSENVPTVLGSLSTAKPDELMFLVLTVKPVEE
jgi:hypothetical protein